MTKYRCIERAGWRMWDVRCGMYCRVTSPIDPELPRHREAHGIASSDTAAPHST
jgi:hypothetical protein